MADIRFREIQEICSFSFDEDERSGGQGGKEDEEFVACAFGEGEIDLPKELIKKHFGVGDELSADIQDIILGLSGSMTEGMTVAFAYYDDVLYARIYDGERYVFPLPFMLTENANAEGACSNLAAYAARELIPLIITDVPREELEFLCSVFPHVDAYTYEDDDDSFYVKVNNECDMLDGVPSFVSDGITLDEITDTDKDIYAQLCRDKDLNKYWGYDVECDNPDGDAQFYLDTVRRELGDGIAITLAIRESGEFVGEATIYGFDYRGTASIAVRVLRTCHSRGIGSRAVKALIELGRKIGITTLCAEILEKNERSIQMTSKYMEIIRRENGKVYFALTL